MAGVAVADGGAGAPLMSRIAAREILARGVERGLSLVRSGAPCRHAISSWVTPAAGGVDIQPLLERA